MNISNNKGPKIDPWGILPLNFRRCLSLHAVYVGSSSLQEAHGEAQQFHKYAT